MDNSYTKKKQTGSTFTPVQLADFLSRKILSYYTDVSEETCILDPACGDGILLSSINKYTNYITKIIGYDTNIEYLKKAESIINLHNPRNKGKFYNEDFLSICPEKIDLFSCNIQRNFADIVIANPPYVRTQILGAEKSQQLASDFNLKGKVDLYYPFLIAMTNALKIGGIIGVITSNRYLCTKSGREIRKFLRDNYEILEIIDLGDTKLFEAAVLPAIFIGIKKSPSRKQSRPIKYSSIYECNPTDNFIKESESIYHLLEENCYGIYKIFNKYYEYKKGCLKISNDINTLWQLEDSNSSTWIETIDKNSTYRIKDLFKVRVGVKSCADSIFITQKWMDMEIEIEPELLRPMLSQENIDTWRISHETMVQVLYPHYSHNGKRMVYDLLDFPNARRYLEIFRPQLEQRSYLIRSNRKWYEYWVPQNPELFKLPKVVFPDISIKPRFCFDGTGSIVNGNCYWICAQTKEEINFLLLIEGVCNSAVMTKYHDLKFTNKLYSGRRRYLSQYIEEYPIPDPNCEASKRIIQLVDRINHISDNITLSKLSSEIDCLVEQAFGLTD